MGPDLSDILKDVRAASENISRGEARTRERFDAIEQSTTANSNSINEIYKQLQRPGWNTGDVRDVDERKSAIGMCRMRKALTNPRIEANISSLDDYTPSSAEISEALNAKKALSQYLRHGDVNKIADPEYRKSLSAFSFGGTGFLLAPEQANRVLSCLVDPSDLGGLVDRVTISSGSLKYLIDNARMGFGAWACESSCFSNNPQPEISEGLGTLEIKAETIRMIVCATLDLLQDASTNVEAWLMRKISEGMRITINAAILMGDGVGKPMGLLNPNSNIPIAETAPATPAGQFTWQDLLMLKFEIPVQWHPGSVFLMNQRTFAQLMTMTDASHRPIWASLPQSEPGFMLAGSPIVIASQMPDVAAGSTPILFGNLKQTYTVVDRQDVQIQADPFSAGFCVLFKASARVGGGVTCSNASRLLRIR